MGLSGVSRPSRQTPVSGQCGGGVPRDGSSIGTMHESAQTASDQSLYLVVSPVRWNPDQPGRHRALRARPAPCTLAEEGAVLGRTTPDRTPVLEPDHPRVQRAREGARDEHTPATTAPAAGTPTAEVHALYCEDDALQAVAAELNAAEPNSQEGPVQASLQRLPLLPGAPRSARPRPLRRRPGPPRLPHRKCGTRLHR